MFKRIKLFLLLLTLAFLTLSYLHNQTFVFNTDSNDDDYLETNSTYYSVLKIIDGDTISVEINGEEKKIRILGINTPESVDPDRPVECYGIEASNYLKQWLGGSKIKIYYDRAKPKNDDYGRLLAYIMDSEQVDIGATLITKGYAKEYTYKNEWYAKQTQYRNLEKTAKDNSLGLWGECS